MPLTDLERGIKERETLRPQRIANYRIKFADGPPRCRHEGCPTSDNLYVVRIKSGFSVRCQVHVGKLQVVEGQRT